MPAAATDAPVVPAGAADAAGLARFVRCYDDDLDADVCAGLVAGFHGMGDAQQRNGRGVRAGLDDSAWTELDVGRHADAHWTKWSTQEAAELFARHGLDGPIWALSDDGGRF